MSMAIEKYLDRVMIYADLPGPEAAQVRAELRDHLLAKTEQLKERGTPVEDAVFRAIEDHGDPRKIGYGLRPKFKWVDVRLVGTARGFIAVGPRAIGVFSFGGLAIGVVPVGGFSIGLFPMGGFALALLLGWGGVCIAPVGVALGGVAIGLVALGGVAAGVIASGGMAAGLLADGGVYASLYTLETAPAWMTYLADMVPTERQTATASMALMALFFPALIAGLLIQWREVTRVRRLDPRMAD